MTQSMVNYVYAKTVTDSTNLHLIKGPKSKTSRGSMPPDPPTLSHALYTDMYMPPPGKKLKETLIAKLVSYCNVTQDLQLSNLHTQELWNDILSTLCLVDSQSSALPSLYVKPLMHVSPRR